MSEDKIPTILDIPTIVDSGSSGEQKISTLTHTLADVEKNKFPEQETIAGTFIAAAESKPRGFGPMGSVMAAGLIRHLENEVETSKSEVKELRQELEKTVTQVHEWKEKAAVLKAQNESLINSTKLKKGMLGIGTFMLTASIGLVTSEDYLYAAITVGIGLLLFIIGWQSPKIKGSNNDS